MTVKNMKNYSQITFDELVTKIDKTLADYDIYFAILSDINEYQTTAFHIDHYINDKALQTQFANEKVLQYSIISNNATMNAYVSVLFALAFE